MITQIKAALGFSNLSPADLVTNAQSIKDTMQSSGNFAASSMPITYPSIQTLITNLHNSVIAAVNGTPADTAYMHEQKRLLISAFNFLKAHVELVANGNSSTAESVITSAGMQVSIIGGGNAVTELTLTPIGNGKIQVRVPRQTGEKAFVFESSVDDTTWTEFAACTDSKVTLSNQTPGATVYIRHFAINKTGKSAYSQSKNTMVL